MLRMSGMLRFVRMFPHFVAIIWIYAHAITYVIACP